MSRPGDERPSSRRRLAPVLRSVRLWGILLFVMAFAAAMLVLDRRGARVLAPPPSSAAEDPPPLPAPALSAVSVSVTVDVGVVERALEERTPYSFGDAEDRRTHPAMPRISYAVKVERDPLELELRNDTVRLTTVVHYDARVWFASPLGGELTASCERPAGSSQRPRALLRLVTPVEIGTDWSVATATRIEELRPVSDDPRDRCRVRLGPLQTDVTDLLLEVAEAQLRELAEELGDALDDFDLQGGVARHWALVQEPVLLGEGVWLRLGAESVRLGDLGGLPGQPRVLAADLAVLGRPRISVGSPPAGPAVPLPPLRRGSVPDRSVVFLDAGIEYPSASRAASDALVGRELTVASRTVRVEDVDVSALGDGRLEIGLDVDGAVRGRLYLVGTPHLDPETGEVTVPDLRFSVQTRSVLVRSAAWLLRGAVPGRIQRAARWNASAAVERARIRAARHLPRDLGGGVRLTGRLDEAELLSVTARREALVVRSRVAGGVLRVRVDAEAP